MTSRTLRHRSASGSLSNFWEYNRALRAIEASIDTGGRSVDVVIPVCPERAPERDAFPIRAVTTTAECWVVASSRFTSSDGSRVACPAAFGPNLSPMFLHLTNAPDSVRDELLALTQEGGRRG